MAEGQRIDGRHLTTQAAEILAKVHNQLSGLAGKVNADRIPEWQSALKSMIEDIPLIQEKLFLKTQGGTHWAQTALEKVQTLASLVAEGLAGQSVDQATDAVEAAVEAVKTELGGLIEKTKTHIIRMT
ncbi:MAG: hypothetical protein ACUVWZ_07195 [Anaerolineae bacterium]